MGQLLPPWEPGTGIPSGAGPSASTGVQAGGPPLRRPGPMPPAAPPHSSASEPGWTPASAGGPSGGAGRGTGPPGRGGDGGAPPAATCAGCAVPPDTAPRPPPPCPGRCGWPRGHSRGTASALARVLTAAPSCPFSAARQMCGGRATRVALCCAIPCHSVPRRAAGSPCSAPAAAALAGGEGAPAGEEALPPPGLGPAGSAARVTAGLVAATALLCRWERPRWGRPAGTDRRTDGWMNRWGGGMGTPQLQRRGCPGDLAIPGTVWSWAKGLCWRHGEDTLGTPKSRGGMAGGAGAMPCPLPAAGGGRGRVAGRDGTVSVPAPCPPARSRAGIAMGPGWGDAPGDAGAPQPCGDPWVSPAEPTPAPCIPWRSPWTSS